MLFFGPKKAIDKSNRTPYTARTFAQLARQAGADIEQIQLSLGHSSIQTTERYLGTKQNLSIAPADMMKLHLE